MHSGDLGDHIGMESSIDLETDTASALSSGGGGGGGSKNRKRWGMSKSSSVSGKKPNDLPPPLPIQTSTVMKRYYTDDGRLVITEEKIESPKYHFTAHRSDGRLTIQLVHSDSSCDNCQSCENGEGKEIVEDECSGKVAVGGGDGGGGAVAGSAVLGKCFRYNAAVVTAAATGSCLFVNQNQLPAMRPVQI